MKRILCGFLIMVALSLFFSVAPASAETRIFVKEYSYQASEADSKLTSRAIALEQIKRLLLEELGTYLTSRTEVKNAQLTRDEIISFTAGSVATIIITESWNGSEYYLKAQLKADPDQVAEAITAIKKNEETAEELQRLRTRDNESLREIERLKKELADLKKNSSSANEDKIAKAQKEYNQKVAGLSTKDIVHEGLSLMREKKYPQAIEQFDKAIQNDSKAVSPYILRGIALNRSREYDKALNNFNQAIAVSPDEALFYLHRGNVYMVMKDYDRAMQDYDSVLRLRPNLVGAMIMKARVYRQRNDYEAAATELVGASQLYRQHYGLYCELGNTYFRMKRYGDAVKVLSTGIEIKPLMTPAYVLRSQCYLAMKMKKKAIVDLEKAASLGNKAAQSRLDRLKRNGKPDKSDIDTDPMNSE